MNYKNILVQLLLMIVDDFSIGFIVKINMND